jgi:hypothetical protein
MNAAGADGSVERKGEGAEPRYNHHRLEAYEATLEFIRWRRAVLRRLPRGSLANQLDRAAASVALNIAEACGESSRTAQEHFFRLARRSATECDAALDVIGGDATRHSKPACPRPPSHPPHHSHAHPSGPHPSPPLGWRALKTWSQHVVANVVARRGRKTWSQAVVARRRRKTWSQDVVARRGRNS